jgi:predicted phosphodiesterase
MDKRKNYVKMFILGVLAFVFMARFSHAALKMTPYLQAVTANSIYILVETDSTSPVYAEYGLSSKYSAETATGKIELTTAHTYIHKIKLSQLAADTEYHYRIHQGLDYSADYTFFTAANPGTEFRFAWMADCRTGTRIHDEIAKRIQDAKPRFSLYGGDLCSNSSYQAFKDEFFRPSELILDGSVPFFNTVGNHEGWTQNTEAFTEAPISPSGDQAYYSFNYGDLHVLVLNYMDEKATTIAESVQYKFAKADLQNSIKTWKIVICHSPAYCAGGHGEDQTMKIFNKDIFEPNGVAMVISGHSHFYQHNFVNGIHHMVIGTAGAELYTPKNASYTLKSVKDYNYAIVDVSSAFMHMIIYNNRGQVLDKINLERDIKE